MGVNRYNTLDIKMPSRAPLSCICNRREAVGGMVCGGGGGGGGGHI